MSYYGFFLQVKDGRGRKALRMINWLDPKSVIEHLRETEGVYLAAVIPTMADPMVGRFSSGETASPEVRRDGLNPDLLLIKGSGECSAVTARVAEAILNDGVLQQKGIIICFGAKSPTLIELWGKRNG